MRIIIACLFLFIAELSFAQSAPSKKDVLHTMNLVNGYFMQKYPDPTLPTYVRKMRPSNIWTRAVYYEGLMELYKIKPDTGLYNYTLNWADFHKWGVNGGNTTKDADNQCCGQTYIELYSLDRKPERLANIKACVENSLAQPENNAWTWIDALQMAMPVYAKLGAIYHDKRYFEKMFQMYRHTKCVEGTSGLFNPKDGLWWRDAKYIPPYSEPNGSNCYWSRGNGWVYAALVRVLTILPKNEKHREEYIRDFLRMSQAIKACQRDDGFWNVSLHDSTNFGGKETTGTSLFVYGLAWGINQKLLSKIEYQPIVLKAWEGLVNHAVQPNGFLGWVQGAAQSPADNQPLAVDKVPAFDDFAVGCFLLGASEIYALKCCKK